MRLRSLLALLVAVSFAAGCRSAPTTRYYVLAPSGPAHDGPASNSSGGLRIGVEPFTVDPPYDSDRLVYRLGSESVEVGFYAYHRWAAPLGDLVAVAMAEGLRGTEGVEAIEPVTAGSEYAAFLRGRVIYLEEIDTPGRQEARLRFELRLVDKDGGTLWSDVVSGAATGQAETVEDVVEQLYEAFAQALEQTRVSLASANPSQ